MVVKVRPTLNDQLYPRRIPGVGTSNENREKGVVRYILS